MLMLAIFGLVNVSDLSGEYAPGPMPSLGFSGRFSPILKDLTLELNLYPSSYWPGATSTSPPLAKEVGLDGDDPILILGIFGFVTPSALSGS